MSELSDIKQRLSALRSKISTALFVDGSARVAGVILAIVALSFLLDRVFKLEAVARGVLLVAAIGGLGWVVWRYLIHRMAQVPGEDPLAVAVERRFPELKDRLISAIQLAREDDPERYGMSPALIKDAIHEAFEPVKGLQFGDVVAGGKVMKAGLLGLLALGLLAGGAAADPESASIWFQRNVLLRNVRWPQKTYLELDAERFRDGHARIVRGADFVVSAKSVGEIHPDKVTLHYEDSEGDSGVATMKADRQNHVYRHEFTQVSFPITFHLEGGDEVTDDYYIDLLDPPEVSELELQVGFPEYAGRDPVTIDLATGDPEVLRGGFVILSGKSSKPLENVELVLGESEENTVTGKVIGKNRFELRYDNPQKTVLAGVRLRDTDGLTNPSLAPRFLIRVLDDRAPKLRLMKRGIGSMVVSGALVPWRLRAHDDVKVMSGRLEVLKGAGDRKSSETHEVELAAEQFGIESVEIEGEMELAAFDLNPGAFLSIHAYGKDNAHPEAHEGKSDPITFKVVTMEELFSDLRRRQQEQRRLFEELIKREERLRDRFLDLRDAPPAASEELSVRLEAQGQDQREIGRRVHAIERAMDQIFNEMYYNRIAEAGRIARLRSAVVQGLANLRKRTIDGHAKLLDASARRSDSFQLAGEDGDDVQKQYAAVLRAMRAVLANMIKVEGFTEIVETMRAVIAGHGKVRVETERKLEAVLRDIFGNNPPPDKKPGR